MSIQQFANESHFVDSVLRVTLLKIPNAKWIRFQRLHRISQHTFFPTRGTDQTYNRLLV